MHGHGQGSWRRAGSTLLLETAVGPPTVLGCGLCTPPLDPDGGPGGVARAAPRNNLCTRDQALGAEGKDTQQVRRAGEGSGVFSDF